MPRYFLDTNYRGTFVEDPEGLECADYREARRRARAVLADFARDTVLHDEDARTMRCRVRDETGRILLQAALAFTMRDEGREVENSVA